MWVDNWFCECDCMNWVELLYIKFVCDVMWKTIQWNLIGLDLHNCRISFSGSWVKGSVDAEDREHPLTLWLLVRIFLWSDFKVRELTDLVVDEHIWALLDELWHINS